MPKPDPLSRRERQIVDALFALGEAPIPDIRSEMVEPPSANAVRTLLQILEEKGHVKRRKVGRNYVFSPTTSKKRAGKGALKHVLETFYEGSLEQAVAAHFSGSQKGLDETTYQRLRALIDEAREGQSEQGEESSS